MKGFNFDITLNFITAVPVHKVVSRIAEIWNLNTFKIRRKLAEVSDMELIKIILKEPHKMAQSHYQFLYPFLFCNNWNHGIDI